jgi:PAS domain S-box-containing protein
MTVATLDQSVSITRCGLCKIDRKGRFILASPEVQKFFGLSEVELFGRPFIDFIQSSDRQIYQQLIKNRSPYDTGYDSVGVSLVGAGGEPIPVTLIVSINFGGGNPANYQIVIRPDSPALPDSHAQTGTNCWETLVRLLVLEFDTTDCRKLAELMKTLTGAATVAIFELDDPSRPCLASTDDNSVNLAELDRELKRDEGGQTPPDEIRATFQLNSTRTGMVRLALRPRDAVETDADVRWRSELAASLIHAVRPPSQVESVPQAQPVVSPSQVLDQLRIGFVAFNRDGRVSQHNQTFHVFVAPPTDVETVSQLVEAIGLVCGEAAASTIDGYLSVLSGCDCLPGFKATYDTSDSRSLSVEILPLEPCTEQGTHCFLFYESGSIFAHPSPTRGVSSQVGNTAIELLQSTMEATASVWQKLEHEHYERLTRDGGFYLGCLSHHLDTMADTINDFQRMLKLIGDEEEPQVTDLGLLVAQVSDSILASHPGAPLLVRHSDLPKVTAPLRKMTAVLHDVLAISLPTASDRPVEATITASVENGSCVIWVRDNGPGLSARQKKTLFTLRRSFAKDKSGKPGGLTVGVAVAREILASIGGTLELDSRPGKGTIVKIVFPT